jgi:hypothetical protein
MSFENVSTRIFTNILSAIPMLNLKKLCKLCESAAALTNQEKITSMYE